MTSIIIVNWNTNHLLKKCLTAVYNTADHSEFEIYVIDNGSSDGSADMVKQHFPDVHLITNCENLGFAKANNQGIQASQGDYVLLLNSDAFLQNNILQLMVNVFTEYPKAGIVGANLFYEDGQPQDSHGPLPTFKSESLSLLGLDKLQGRTNGIKPEESVTQTGYVRGACLMARRAMFDQIGLFDENYFFFNEEIDLCNRAHQAGWQVLHLPSARVIHLEGGSSGLNANRILMLYRAKLQYFAKHFGRSSKTHLFRVMWITTCLKIVVYSILRLISKKHFNNGKSWQSVLRGLKGLATI